MESPGDSGRLLKVAGACQLSVSSGRRHIPALQPQCRDSSRVPLSQNLLQLGQGLSTHCLGIHQKGWVFREDPRTDR